MRNIQQLQISAVTFAHDYSIPTHNLSTPLSYNPNFLRSVTKFNTSSALYSRSLLSER